jgi:predicted XRE-type DNA-binding protein
VSFTIFPAEKAAEIEIRAKLLMGLEHWLEKSCMTQAEAAKVLGATRARVSDLKRGKIDRFSMDLLVRLAARGTQAKAETRRVKMGQSSRFLLWRLAVCRVFAVVTFVPPQADIGCLPKRLTAFGIRNPLIDKSRANGL